jgi:uncharacterized protein (TIGR00251 family)
MRRDLPPLRIAVRVQPRSSRDRIVGRHGNALKVQLTAPPVDGAANAALVDLLAEWLGVPRRSVAVTAGQRGRDKTVSIAIDDPAERGRVGELLAGLVDSP